MTKKRKLRKMTAEDRARRDETQRMAQERIAYHEAKAREEEEARLGERFRVTRVECFLEPAPENLSLEEDVVARTTRREPHDADGLVPAAVTPGVALGLAQWP